MRALDLLDNKAQQVVTKRFLEVLGIRRVKLVLFRIDPNRQRR